MNYFTFDGIDSRTYNTYIATSNAFDAPGREDEVIKVPGSNNIYYLTEGTYKPFDIKLYCYIPSNMQVKTDDLRNFLLSKGTCRYTEAIRPNEFRVARFIEAYELDVSDRVSAAFVLTFKAQPQRYLTTNTPITTTATADTTTDTTMSLSTVPTPINISLNGNTTQEGTPTPSTPQAIHNVSGDNEIKVVNKNLFDIENDYVNTKFSLSGGTLFNTATDTKTYFFLSILALNGNTVVSVIYANSFSTTGEKSVTFNSGDLSNVTRLRLKHNGSINDLEIAYVEKSSLTANTSYTLSFNLISNNPTTVNGLIINNIQLEVGSTATTYEPYTRQSYPLYLPVENYCNWESTWAGYLQTDGTLKNPSPSLNWYFPQSLIGKQVTISAKAKAGVSTANLRIRTSINGTATNANMITNTDNFELTKITVTPTSTSDYFALYSSTNNGYFKDIQVEVGANASQYNPYGNPYIELNKIGTYQDYIYKNGGKWYVHKALFKYIENGQNNVVVASTSYIKSDALDFFVNPSGMATNAPAPLTSARCNKLTAPSTYTAIWNNVGYPNMFMLNSNQLHMNIANSIVGITTPSSETTATAQTKAVTYLQTQYNNGTPLEFILPLATPTNTEITDTTLINQLNNIEKAYSYNGTTNILQVSNDNGFMLEVVSLHSNDVSSDYKGEPIITVNSTGLIYFNGCVIRVNQAPMTINSQTMQAYNGTVNLNNYIEANDFPMIEVGTNVIGSEMPLSIVPNYWKL